MHLAPKPALNIRHEHINYRKPYDNIEERSSSKQKILLQKLQNTTVKGLPALALGASISLFATGLATAGGACSLIGVGIYASLKANIKSFNSTQTDAEKHLKDAFDIVFTPNTGTAYYAIRLKPEIDPKAAAFYLYGRSCPNILGNEVTYEKLINKINKELLQQTAQLQSPLLPPNEQGHISEEIVNAAAKAIRFGAKDYIGRSVAIKSVAAFSAFAVAGGLIGSAAPLIGTGFGILGGVGIGIVNAFITYHNYQKGLDNLEGIIFNQLKNRNVLILNH